MHEKVVVLNYWHKLKDYFHYSQQTYVQIKLCAKRIFI